MIIQNINEREKYIHKAVRGSIKKSYYKYETVITMKYSS